MFGSEDEDCDSEPGSWAYEEDVPLDLSGKIGTTYRVSKHVLA